MNRRTLVFAVVVVSVSACPAGSPTDGGTNPPDDSGTPSDAGPTDAGSTDAGPSDAGAISGPISAPADQWTWVDFPDSKCASGTPTGLAVNPHAGSNTLLIYFEGGGSCHDATSCWGPSPTAKDLSGFDATTFAASKQVKLPALDRNQAGNPFATMNMAYVPYCTGDLHAGNTVAALNLSDGGVAATHFVGAANVQAFLARLVPTFPSTQRVWLLGTSAGGFGTFLNFDRVATAFGVPVDIVDDSGPPIVAKAGSNNQGLFALWNLLPPAGCSGCNSFAAILGYDLQAQKQVFWVPPGQFGFLSFTEDTVIAPDFGYTLAEYPAVMQNLSTSLPASPTAATFLVSNKQAHVVESDPTLASQYLPWMTGLVTRDTGWADVAYVHP